MVEDHSDHSASIGSAKSTLDQDSSVAMMCHDPSSSTRPCVKGGGEGGGDRVVLVRNWSAVSAAVLSGREGERVSECVMINCEYPLLFLRDCPA